MRSFLEPVWSSNVFLFSDESQKLVSIETGENVLLQLKLRRFNNLLELNSYVTNRTKRMVQ